jgi:hypothetical protein
MAGARGMAAQQNVAACTPCAEVNSKFKQLLARFATIRGDYRQSQDASPGMTLVLKSVLG